MTNQTDSTINNGLDFDRLGGTNPEPSIALGKRGAATTTLEKAARALAVADGESEDDFLGYVIGVRAVVKALKPATPDMRIAGGIAGASAGSAETWVDIADATWNAMLNAILNEKPDA